MLLGQAGPVHISNAVPGLHHTAIEYFRGEVSQRSNRAGVAPHGRQSRLPCATKLTRAEGFDLLVDAHYKLSKLHTELIFGVLGNWGGIALDFTKVFEVELMSALGAIVRGPAYQQFKASHGRGRSPGGRPTLGSFMHLLREYAQLPITLQTQLASASTLHGNPQLLTKLEKIISEHRNPAAHAAGYGPHKFQELLDLLYRQQVLPEFIDTLKLQGRSGAP